MKAALITNIPTPYRIPLFNRMAEQLAVEGDELHVLFQMSTYHRRRWSGALAEARFPHEILNLPAIPLGREKVLAFPAGLPRAVEALRPDILVTGGFGPVSFSALRAARLLNIPLILWSGETAAAASDSRWPALRRIWRGRMRRGVAGYVAYGSAAREYLLSLGIPSTSISIAQNTVDTGFFAREVRALRSAELREPGAPLRLLFVGHIHRRKGVHFLLRAMKLLEAEKLVLDVVGDGPERAAAESLAAQLGLRNVTFHGFRQKPELPPFYARSDIFLFPSLQELYGLVLIEAAAAGLPLVASERAGATRDIVREGESGYSLDPSDPEAVAERIRRLTGDEELRRRMGKRAAELAAGEFSLETSAAQFVHALRLNASKPSGMA